MVMSKVTGVAGRRLAGAGIMLTVLCGCEQRLEPGFMGSAVMESRTWTVSSTVQGTLVEVAAGEGERITAGTVVAVVDTVPLQFLRREAEAGIGEIAATLRAGKAEIEAGSIDVAGLEREFKRIDGQAAKGAATAQQRDNLSTQLQAAQAKLAAANSALQPLAEKEKSLRIRLESIGDQIRRCMITAPGSGVVLTRFRNRGEVVGPGSPVCEIGEVDTLTADFFVTQPVLATVSRGQEVTVRLDWDSAGTAGEKRIPAAITWIGEEAEFTPKNIQTRRSRNGLVFRVRCSAANADGMLKRGLPVEIWR